MDANRKSWNERQQALRQALNRPEEHPQAVALFLTQHAMVHAAEMSQHRACGRLKMRPGLGCPRMSCAASRPGRSIRWPGWRGTSRASRTSP